MVSGQRRSKVHHGRVSDSFDEPRHRPRRTAVTVTAWVVVGGLALAVIAPVIALLFG
jgi:hypothetical protein